MEDSVIRFFRALHRNNYKKSWLVMSLIIAGIIAVLVICGCGKENQLDDLFINILASIIGFVLAYMFLKLLEKQSNKYEDENKISYRNSDMWEQYHTNYRHIFDMGRPSKFVVYFDDLFVNKKGTKIKVVDDPQKFFELDPFIKAHCDILLSAHNASKKTDSVTVRLADFNKPTKENGNTATIHCMRSSYLAHLLTNRALDYMIKDELTIRRLYEHDTTLRPLTRSQLSNHFGVNALVFLKGENEDRQAWLLLPHRKNTATVAKNKVIASIADRLKMENEKVFPEKYANHMTEDYIKKGCIEYGIADHIWVMQKWIDDECQKRKKPEDKDFIKINLLGLSRDIYEGGKPTLFYAVYLDCTLDEYREATKQWKEEDEIKQANREAKKTKNRLLEPNRAIDEIDKIHIARWSSIQMETIKDEETGEVIDPEPTDYYDIRLDKAKLIFDEWDEESKTVKPAEGVEFEQNLIANFWFYNQWLNEQKKSQ